MRLLVPLVLSVLLAGSAWAQTEGYAPWQDEGAETQELIERLKLLIDRAERDRAADPRFLQDLRRELLTFDRPWQAELIRDDFRDRDYTSNPAWTVASGRFYIDYSGGLRSRVTPREPTPPSGQSQSGDLAGALLGTILQQAMGPGESASDRLGPDRAEAFIERRITNAFAVRVALASSLTPGRLELGVYQGKDRSAGYRLAYNPGGTPSVELLATSLRGTSIIELYDQPLALEDGRSHFLEWTRHPSGQMAVTLDEKTLFEVSDRRFRDPFDGVTLVNAGGDFSLREIAVYGAD